MRSYNYRSLQSIETAYSERAAVISGRQRHGGFEDKGWEFPSDLSRRATTYHKYLEMVRTVALAPDGEGWVKADP